MRRFEFVGGTSAKFWSCALDGATFTVVYGRLGTDGQRKDKVFDDDAAAKKEYDKKVAEKLKEGYVEVEGTGSAPAGVTGAAAASAKVLALPPRPGTQGDVVDVALIAAAAAAVDVLVRAAADRSWRRQMALREALRALRRVPGVDIATTGKPLGDAIDRLCQASISQPALPLAQALQVLDVLPGAAVDRAVTIWSKPAGPAAPALAVLAAVRAAIDDGELAWRVGRLLVDRSVGDDSAQRRFNALRPFLDAHGARAGTTSKAWLGSLADHGDSTAQRRRQAFAA